MLKTNENIDEILDKFKPTIFWKEKEIVKYQISIWSLEKIKNLIIETNNVELLIKSNPQLSIISITNFVLDTAA